MFKLSKVFEKAGLDFCVGPPHRASSWLEQAQTGIPFWYQQQHSINSSILGYATVRPPRRTASPSLSPMGIRPTHDLQFIGAKSWEITCLCIISRNNFYVWICTIFHPECSFFLNNCKKELVSFGMMYFWGLPMYHQKLFVWWSTKNGCCCFFSTTSQYLFKKMICLDQFQELYLRDFSQFNYFANKVNLFVSFFNKQGWLNW